MMMMTMMLMMIHDGDHDSKTKGYDDDREDVDCDNDDAVVNDDEYFGSLSFILCFNRCFMIMELVKNIFLSPLVVVASWP